MKSEKSDIRSEKFRKLRQQMVDYQLAARGLKDQSVLDALNTVPREEFIPTELVESAYADIPLPIGVSQTISQPYIVAIMTAALELQANDRVLEIGTGSGYAAAVLGEIVDKVYTIERHKDLANTAKRRLKDLNYKNIQVLHGDGTLGWPEYAPFDAIIVAAWGPNIPETLKKQLTIGGRLIIPVGSSLQSQKLIRVKRVSKNKYTEEDLGSVRFVPLIGSAGWKNESETPTTTQKEKINLSELIYESSEHFSNIDEVNLDNLMDRIGDSRIVLLGESSHWTAEFYEMRARITKELIEKKGFSIICVEADWPDASHINSYINGVEFNPLQKSNTFSRFPTWMWANHCVMDFIHWVKTYNEKRGPDNKKINFYGLDLYSLFHSIEIIINYLEKVDPKTAEIARLRYACLMPWSNDPLLYARATFTKQYKDCEEDVIKVLRDLLKKRIQYSSLDNERLFDAIQNAQLVKNAENYYRTMYHAEQKSWNLRDKHMFDTLESILKYHGSKSKVVIWEHNSHIGDARATQMSARGEFNVGQLVRETYNQEAYLIGFGTDHGTVAAASDWDGPMEIKEVQASHIDSYERIFHETKTDNFLLPLRNPLNDNVRKELLPERLERAIGVIYRPDTELQSHYFYASLPRQFDEYIWFDETRAVEALTKASTKGMPDTFPFGL